jgi:hypothetical protein
MAAKAANLYAAVTQSGSVVRLGEITILRMDGAGAVAVPTISFTVTARWASGRPASGIPQRDRMQFLDRFELFLARPSSMVQTRGSAKPLYDLLKAMERSGLDIHEWSIPNAVEELIKEAALSQDSKKDTKDQNVRSGDAPPESGHK